MNVAIIGTGISGLAAAWLLSRRYEVELFERETRLGGHTNTLDVLRKGRTLPVDTGFIVFNPVTYPNLVKLFDRLGVASRESDMSFSVSCRRCRLEYSGRGARGLFAQKSNLLRPSFLKLLIEIARFNREAPRFIRQERTSAMTLGAYLDSNGYSSIFRRHYLVPLVAAVWSAGSRDALEMPAGLLLTFLENHGMLVVDSPLKWRTVVGGSRSYVEAMARDLKGRVWTGVPVRGVRRTSKGASLLFGEGPPRHFDHVVIATHADEALALLDDPTPDEKRLLGPWSYTSNDTWLHTDSTFLPMRKAARSSWNYQVDDCAAPPLGVGVSYHMNRLQGLSEPEDYIVTLNPTRSIAQEFRVARINYTHPTFTTESLATQERLPELNRDALSFCGSYFGYGFHEDGLNSAIQVATRLGASFP